MEVEMEMQRRQCELTQMHYIIMLRQSCAHSLLGHSPGEPC